MKSYKIWLKLEEAWNREKQNKTKDKQRTRAKNRKQLLSITTRYARY